LNWPGVSPPGNWAPFTDNVTVGEQEFDLHLVYNSGAMRVGQFDFDYGDIFSSTTGDRETSYVDHGYSAGTYFRDFSCLWSSATGNFISGIVTLSVNSSLGNWQMKFTPPLPKDDTVSLKIT